MKIKNEKAIEACVGYINLGGIGLTVNEKDLKAVSMKKRKTYNLRLNAEFSHGNVQTDVKIMIIEMVKNDLGGWYCRTLYRFLTDAQVTALKEISDNVRNGLGGVDEVKAVIVA